MSNFNLENFFNSSSLITRQAARELFDFISKTPDNNIVLDFFNVNFATRSFFDEFNSKMSNLKLLGKNVSFINQNENIKCISDIVINSSKQRSSLSYASVANVEIVSL